MRLLHVTATVEGAKESELWSDGELQRQEVTLEHIKQHLSILTEEILARYADDYLLFFWAYSTFFKVMHQTHNRRLQSGEYSETRWSLVLDEKENIVGNLCRTYQQHWKSRAGKDGGRPQEFIAVGRRRVLQLPEDIAPTVILALQIERDEDGIASRVSMAEIHEKAWINAEPKKMLVALA